MSESLTRRKIQPRNLTAHADALVRGNPVSTRPESGVENCYPGLEFDQRNLDKRFFPGLVLEFHSGGTGAFVRAVEPTGATPAGPLPLGEDDIRAGVFLLALYGMHGRQQNGERGYAVDLSREDGLDAWRVVHDLEPGPITILLGPAPGAGAPPLSVATLRTLEELGRTRQERVERSPDGTLAYAVLSGERARYLDADGVIDPLTYEPGDLTRSLCAPWQYDFRDCGCFYWASNKPDMVAAQPGAPQILNFQRSRAEPSAEGAPPARDYATWTGGEFSHMEMIVGWESLPAVVDTVETAAHELTRPVQLPPAEVLTREQALARLRYLATVEHGLMVEYLYAYYSLAAPRRRPETAGTEQNLYDAARIVLGVAIDEMRHLRWANEMLRELGEPAELGRVETFEDFDDDERTFGHVFSLQPLTWERLDWFIEVEKPSREVDPARRPGTVDGLYTRLLLSVNQSQSFTEAERHQLQHLIKLIIDEGHDHFLRFSRVKEMLKGLDLPSHLRLPTDPQPVPGEHPGHAYQQVADNCYAVVLTTLRFVFEQGGSRVGEMLDAARHAMYALDDAAHAAAAAGGAPLFRLPVPVTGMAPQMEMAASLRAGAPVGGFDALIDPLVERALEPLATVRDGRELGDRLRTRYAALGAAMRSLA